MAKKRQRGAYMAAYKKSHPLEYAIVQQSYWTRRVERLKAEKAAAELPTSGNEPPAGDSEAPHNE